MNEIKFKETKNGIVCGYCGWKIDKPSDSLNCCPQQIMETVEN